MSGREAQLVMEESFPPLNSKSESPADVYGSQGESPGRRLRVGLFADSPLQPHWIVEAFQKVVRANLAEITVIACSDQPQLEKPWLWRLYGRADARCFGSGADLALRKDLRTHIAAARRLSLDRDGLKSSRASIAALELDVAFVLGDVDVVPLQDLARHGVWRYWFGSGGRCTHDWAGISETIGGAPLTACGLAVRRRSGEECIVYRSWSRTHPFSVMRNRHNLFRKCVELPLRALTALHRSGDIAAGSGAPLFVDEGRPLAGSGDGGPGPGAFAKFGVRLARRALQKLLCVEQWFLAYRFDGSDRWDNDFRQYRTLMPPKDRLWADPFPIERNGRYFIFFEELPFSTDKGHIAMVEVRRDGTSTPPVRVLERNYHLSYPFLLDLGGQLYMVPETLQNGAVELYRCIEFPARWRLERELIGGARFADATFCQANGRWWMFVNIGLDGAEAYDELHLYHAERFESEWRPHPHNPVKSDVRSARPAGKLFRRNGVLYRPAQICAPLYGSGVSLNRVLHLSTHGYAEQEEERILPAENSGILGLHTINRAGDLSVIDGFVRRSRL